VRSNEEFVGFDCRHNIGFLSNPKRFNVSITRAQSLMVIIGNPIVLCHDPFWCALIQYAVLNDCYKGCNLPSLDVPYVKDNFQKALGLLGSAGLPSPNQQDDDDDDEEFNVEPHLVKGKSNQESPSQEKDDHTEKKNSQNTRSVGPGFHNQEPLQASKDLVKSEERVALAANGGEMYGKEEINREMYMKEESVTDDGRQRTDSNSSTQSQTTTRANALLHSLSTLKR